MACRSYLLCLAFILMFFFASARRPPVENIEAGPAPPKNPDGGDESQYINVEASEPLPSPLSTGGGGKKKISEASPTDVSQSFDDKASVPLPPLNYGGGGKKKISKASQADASQGFDNMASIPLPPLNYGGGGKKKTSEASQTDASRSFDDMASIPLPPLNYGVGGKKKTSEASQADASQSFDDMASIPLPPVNYDEGGKKNINEASQTDASRGIYVEASVPHPSPLSTGGGGKKKISQASQADVTPSINHKIEARIGRLNTQPRSLAVGLIPIISSRDGSFHFTLGPVDFGGDISWGGFTPGYPYDQPQPQPQPYIVVSPYASQYFSLPPYAPLGSGYGQGQPSQGHSGPYPYGRGYAPGSSQTGGFASNQHN